MELSIEEQGNNLAIKLRLEAIEICLYSDRRVWPGQEISEGDEIFDVIISEEGKNNNYVLLSPVSGIIKWSSESNSISSNECILLIEGKNKEDIAAAKPDSQETSHHKEADGTRIPVRISRAQSICGDKSATFELNGDEIEFEIPVNSNVGKILKGYIKNTANGSSSNEVTIEVAGIFEHENEVDIHEEFEVFRSQLEVGCKIYTEILTVDELSTLPIEIDIPENSKDGDIIHQSGMGTAYTKSEKRGDIYITLKAIKDPKIKKLGDEFIEFVDLFTSGQSTPIEQILDSIIEADRAKQEEDSAGWQIVGALAGLFLGIEDGLDMMDLGAAYSMSRVGQLAYEKLSSDDKKYLRSLRAEWLVQNSSPLALRRRFGEVKGRFISCRDDSWIMYSAFYNNTRGFHLVELGTFTNVAPPFRDGLESEEATLFLEKLFTAYPEEEDNLPILNSLYPDDRTIETVKILRSVTEKEACTKEPWVFALSRSLMLKPHKAILQDDKEIFLYSTNIPTHSDY